MSDGEHKMAQTEITIERLDHLVLTVRDLAATCAFYQQALGMQVQHFGTGRVALHFGQQKINLHLAGHEFEPKAQQPTPGSADLCFITQTPLPTVIDHLRRCAIPIEAGPVGRTGARDPLESVYIRDPDQNLIEIANVQATAEGS